GKTEGRVSCENLMLAAGQDHRQSAVIRNRSEATARKREVSNAYKQFAVAALLFRIAVAALLFRIAVAALLFCIAVAALLFCIAVAALLFCIAALCSCS